MGHVGNTSAPQGKRNETYPSTHHFQKECMPLSNTRKMNRLLQICCTKYQYESNICCVIKDNYMNNKINLLKQQLCYKCDMLYTHKNTKSQTWICMTDAHGR
jgi:hypothetical protein